MPAGVLPREKQPQPQRPAVSMTPQAIQQRLIVANQELARHNGKVRPFPARLKYTAVLKPPPFFAASRGSLRVTAPRGHGRQRREAGRDRQRDPPAAERQRCPRDQANPGTNPTARLPIRPLHPSVQITPRASSRRRSSARRTTRSRGSRSVSPRTTASARSTTASDHASRRPRPSPSRTPSPSPHLVATGEPPSRSKPPPRRPLPSDPPASTSPTTPTTSGRSSKRNSASSPARPSPRRPPTPPSRRFNPRVSTRQRSGPTPRTWSRPRGPGTKGPRRLPPALDSANAPRT